MKNHRVLIIQTPAFEPNKGGVQRITYNIGAYFEKKGLTVGYFSFAIEGHIAPEYGQLYYVDCTGGCKRRDNLQKLLEVIREFAPTIVINQMPYEQPIRKCLNEAKGKFKTIGCIHNSLFNFKSNAKDIIKRMMPYPFSTLATTRIGLSLIQFYHKRKHAYDLRKIIEDHDKLLLYTPPNHQELRYFVGDYKSEKVGYMPNPVVEVPELVNVKEKIILHVGRINVPQKRSDLLLEFWSRVQVKLPEWRFYIVGEGPYLNKLELEIEKRKIPRINLLGFQKPEKYYEIASIFMMPSAFEGFPNTILEAQSYGCPVLAFSSYAALNWIVTHKKDAFLSVPFNTSQMAQHATKLAGENKLLIKMQHNARENARRFTLDRVGRKWFELFDSFDTQ